jgi:hypothetical protein
MSRVKLLKKIKHNDTWTFAAALYDSKGRVRRDHVNIQGQDETHPEGSYFLQWWKDGTRITEAAGADAFLAAEKAKTKQAHLDAARNGIIPAEPIQKPNGRVTVRAAIDEYTEYIHYHRSLRTFRTYRPILSAFKQFCKREYIDSVERKDLIDFSTDCLKKGQKGKSVYNSLQ